MISAINKLSKRQPIQELAFHKEQWQINGVQFQCHESYYEGELLNGVDLKIKEVSGLKNRDKTYDYLQDSQELVFCASSNLMVYNTHKRTYHQLFTIDGEVELLKTHLQKMNNRQYIIWVENSSANEAQNKKNKMKKNRSQSKIIKKSSSMNRDFKPKKNNKNFLKSIFSLVPDLADKQKQGNLTFQQGQNNSKLSSFLERRNDPELQNQYILKVFDYTRKEFVFQSPLNVPYNHTIKDLFLFWNHYKIVGYITEQYDTNLRYVQYQNVETHRAKNNDDGLFNLQSENCFSFIETDKQLQSLIFNNELNNFVFFHQKSLNLLKINEDAEDAEQELFKQFLSLNDSKNMKSDGKSKALKLEIQQRMTFESQILSLALNDQYLAILTQNKIYFHSAYDINSLIFTYEFMNPQLEPLNIEFNKSNIMITHRNSPAIFSYLIKNKTLKFMNETALELNHCKEILKIYTNNISSQIFCVVIFYELQSKDFYGNNLANALIENLVEYVMKPAFIDIVGTFISPAAKAEVNLLGISQKKFKKIHTCPWLSAYVVETQQGIQFKKWRETFQNKKCISIHPTGLFLVVCLKQSFKIYVITFEGFVNTYRGDSIKDIQSCSISLQGNHLAVSSTNTIFIYDFYSCAKIRTISLPFGIAIESIEYSRYNLLCYLKNRKIYLYDSLNEYKEIYTFNPKNSLSDSISGKEEQNLALSILAMTGDFALTTFSYIYYDPILNFFIYSYKSTIYFFNCTTQSVQTTVQLEPLSYIYYNANLSTLFFGTENGEIISFSWPNKPVNLHNEQRKFKLHSGRIIDIKVSSDLKELITISEDESLCVCSIVFVQNLKKFQGLQLVEHLSSSIKICYDFLSRKGFYQYTHTKFNDKVDTLKDHQDEVLNMNFILPEQRQKQKEQMFNNVKTNMKVIIDGNNTIYHQINQSTNQARDMVNTLRHQFYEYQKNNKLKKEELKQNMFAEYIQFYNKSQNSIKEVEQLRVKYSEELVATKKDFENKLKMFTTECVRNYENLIEEQDIQRKNWKHDDKAELLEIDVEKKLFIDQNLNSLNQVINDINNNNGILACKNNNIEKEISDIKRKLEEQRYLRYRLESNTNKLKEEQQKYQTLKIQNKKSVQKEDKINLTQIEKRYVKQTQTLIQKDKQINVQLVNYQKEKNILIHLQKCVEEIQENIEQLVENILQEKKDRKEEQERIQNIRLSYKAMHGEVISKKKEKISVRNQFNNYICKLESIIEDIVHTRSREHIIQLLQERELIDKPVVKKKQKKNQENQMLNKIISEKVQSISGQTARNGASRIQILKSNRTNPNFKIYRNLKTQGGEAVSAPKVPFSQRKDFLSVTTRELIDKKSKDIYMKLDAEQKQYERIKTEQMVFKNTRKKFNLENQDLIQNYNTLAVQNKKIICSLKRQESLNRLPIRKQSNFGQGEGSPTPFQLYLQNKAITNRSPRTYIPSKTFQY